jgi:hypothetical protein
VVGAAALLLIIAAAVWYFVIRDDSSSTVHGPSGAPFTVTAPTGWVSLSEAELQQLPGTPLAVLRQLNGTGIVIINSQPQTAASLPKLSKELQAKLKDKISDFQLVKADTINIPAGQALSITYTRATKGTANTLIVIPAGGHVYTMNAVVPAGEEDTARQVTQIINSFNA